MGVGGQHREVVVQLRPGGDPDRVGGWLRQRNLEVLPLAVGLLATGDGATVRAAFGVEPEGELPVPPELSTDVESITIVPPKQLHMDG
jgi:hypothetical protein